MAAILLKLWPGALALIVGAGAWFGGYRMAVKDTKIEIPAYPKCPACNCPPQANVIDFDKIKGFKGTINLNQTYELQVDGDSLVIEAFKKAVDERLENLKVVRCKR